MFCPYCGQEIADGTTRCPWCFAVLESQGNAEAAAENTAEDYTEPVTESVTEDYTEPVTAVAPDYDPSLSTELKNNNWGVPAATTYVNLCEPVMLFKTKAEQVEMEQKLAGPAPAPKKKQSVLGIISFCLSLTVIFSFVSMITSTIDVIIMFATIGKPNAKKHGLGVAAFIISLFIMAILWI